MKKTLSSLGLIAVSAVLVSPAAADPSLQFLVGTNTDGNNVYTFQVTSDDLTGSYAVELAFEAVGDATIVEELFNGATSVDVKSNADTFDGLLGYDRENDSWVYDDSFDTANPGNNPFTSSVTNGYAASGGGTELFISYGSGGNLGSPVDVVQIVTTPGGDLTWSGVVAQGGENFQVSGTTVPEPGSIALLGLGGLALTARRRR